jgi:hypothetical protein
MTTTGVPDQSASHTNRLAQWIRATADGLRSKIDQQRRFPPVLLVVAAAAIAGTLAYGLTKLYTCDGGTASPASGAGFQLTFSAPVFGSLVRAAEQQGCPVVSYPAVMLDTVFPMMYALLLALLVLWLERWRRATPDGTTSERAPTVTTFTLAESALVLAPFAAAIADVLPENLSLLFAAKRVLGGEEAPRLLVLLGSLGAAAKWSLLIAVGLGCAVSLLRGPRGVVIWRTRYSLLAVLLGAVPLLAIAQGQDILQRLVEGAYPWVRIAFAVVVLSMAAIVTWYCARALTQVRLDFDPPRSDPWFPFFERNLPRMLGVAVLLLGALAFARAAESVSRFALLAISSYLGAIAIGAKRRQSLGALVVGLFFRAEYADALKADALITDRLGRAAIGIIASGLMIWPNDLWPLSNLAAFAASQSREAFYLRAGAGGLLFATWALFLFVYFRRDFAAIRNGEAQSLATLRHAEQHVLAVGYPVNTLPKAVRLRASWAFGVSVVAFVLFTYWTVPVARFLGPLGVLAFTAANAVFVGSVTACIGRRHRIALVPLALVFAALVSLWNDNHAIRTLPTNGGPGPSTLAARLDVWLKAREAERAAGDTTPIPLIIASASGGGLRAAYWTALTLSTLQDRESSFAPHLFAVSGVSGGSLGAALFAAMIRDSAQGLSHADCSSALRAAQPSLAVPGPAQPAGARALAPCVKRFMGDDFLAPTIAKLLSSDLLQWFVPVPIPSWDRATALEASFETSYQATIGTRSFAETFESLMDVRNAGRVPALLLNTTHVETGRRYIAAPFTDSALFLDARYVHEELPAGALRVSTAVHNSARFSYVSPAGRIDRQDGIGRGSLVDGGYFENSGLASLNELRHAIELILRSRSASGVHPPVRIVALYLCNDPVSCERESRGDSTGAIRRGTASEWFAPARALLAAREARGGLARRQMMRDMRTPGDFLQFNVCDSLRIWPNARDSSSAGRAAATKAAQERTRERLVNPPLGWLLSAQAQRWMDSSLVPPSGSIAGCPAGNKARMDTVVALLLRRAGGSRSE